jgi:hypothetical protein
MARRNLVKDAMAVKRFSVRTLAEVDTLQMEGFFSEALALAAIHLRPRASAC